LHHRREHGLRRRHRRKRGASRACQAVLRAAGRRNVSAGAGRLRLRVKDGPSQARFDLMEEVMSSLEANSFAAAPARLVSLRGLACRIDRVVLAFALLIAFIAAIDPALAPRTLAHVAAELRGLAPWFALSVLFAAGAKATGGDALVARAFVGREGWAIPL